jgi:hypothetical protein
MSNPTSQKPSSIFEEVKTLARSTQSKFLKIQPGQTITLKFDPNKAKTIEREYQGKKSFAVEYTVTTPEGYEKVLTLSILWALMVNDLLEEGRNTIKIIRRGEGTDTRYSFAAV